MTRLVSIKGRKRRQKRIRARISSIASAYPLVSVFRSNRYLSAQIMDIGRQNTLVSITTKGMKGDSPTAIAMTAGENLAKEAVKKGIKKVVFDRGGYLYTGKIKSLAEGLRKGGLEF